MSPERPEDYQGLEPETAAEPELETSPPPSLRRPVPAVPPAAAASRPVRFEPLNLSRRPFLNTRPVVRVSLLLWALGLLLLLGNVSRYISFREASADKRRLIDQGHEDIMRQEQVSQRLQKQLDSVDLQRQNDRVDYLNQKIQERTFSWSTVLDLIGQRLPNDLRLNRLSPVTGDRSEREFERRVAARRSGAGDQVPLLITGQARNLEALDIFTERLYKAPFDYPNLARQEVQEDGLIKFELSVQYHPGRPAAPGAPGGPGPKIEELPMPGAAGSTAAPGAVAPPPAAAPPGGRP
jgi:hypothetical protein